MSHRTLRSTLTAPIPQSEPLDAKQVPNQGGGYAWTVKPDVLLRRILILGTTEGSYYATERELTKEALTFIQGQMLGVESGLNALNLAYEISHRGLAKSNDPALFVVAAGLASPHEPVKALAERLVPKVARTGTHFLHLVEYTKALRGFGRSTKRALSQWYTERPGDDLAYQVSTYRQRDGWSHRDVLRLLRPKGLPEHDAVLHWAVKGVVRDDAPDLLRAIALLNEATTPSTAANIISMYRVPRASIPTRFLNTPEVWDALLPNLPIGALLRNLPTLTRVGLLTSMSETEKLVVGRITNEELLKRGRVHPISVLLARLVYALGRNLRGERTWQPVQGVIYGLEAAFPISFGNVEPTGLRTLVAVDVSASMRGGVVAGVEGFNPQFAAAAMTTIAIGTEPLVETLLFDTSSHGLRLPDRSLNTALHAIMQHAGGGTDVSLPFQYALHRKLPVDVFHVYTDSVTWAGYQHPQVALEQYRKQMGIDARVCYVQMVANPYTQGRADDPRILEVVGFDADAPTIMNAFALGQLG